MKPNPTNVIRDKIMESALPDIAFDGWTWDVAERAAEAAGYDKAMARAVFPAGLSDVVAHLSDWVDRQMLDALAPIDLSDLRVRDRVHLGVMTRIEILAPWKEALRRAVTYWSVPHRSLQAGRLLWHSADAIWTWAGDTATDYNRTTKRALLAGVISATTLAWLNDDSEDLSKIEAFLDRRIDNVVRVGKALGQFQGKFKARKFRKAA